ncbi:prepilin peptidase [Pseudovibrio denitrificans]|uniref:prepilin peptidase n=1 Tax=Pseudovibrio denitrificans TaxID=258256 RepID=UPI003CC7A7CF
MGFSILLAIILVYGASVDSLWFFIPDRTSAALALSGCIATQVLTPNELKINILAALTIGLGLLAFSKLYVLLRNRTGLGLGDIKLLASSSLWLGFQGVPSAIFLGSVIGIAMMIGTSVGRKKLTFHTRLPFGPPLSLGIWITWLFGPVIFIWS